MSECLTSGRRVLVGFDFPFGYPEGFAGTFPAEGAESDPPWIATAKRLGGVVTDTAENRNDRFEAAAGLNQLIGAPPGPFWGRSNECTAAPALPGGMPPFPFRVSDSISLKQYRRTEQRLRGRGKNVQETWKLNGSGSVGGQSLVGIPLVHGLRWREGLADAAAFWPFETGFTGQPTTARSIIFAEVWPSLIKPSVPNGQIKDAVQVAALAHLFGQMDADCRLGTWFDQPPNLTDGDAAVCVSEEGWILGTDPGPTPALSPDRRRYFRDELRSARANAFEDAEGFLPVIVAIERLGATLAGEVHSLGKYEEAVNLFVEDRLGTSPVIAALDTPFSVVYGLLREGRNDAVHQGAYARLLAEHAVAVAIVLEEALMVDTFAVRDFMVRTPISLNPSQPIAAVRQLMLTHSFSYLPVLVREAEGPSAWRLVSDLSVAQHLRQVTSAERRKRLAGAVGEAIRSGTLVTEPAVTCYPEDAVSKILSGMDRRISLVVEHGSEDRLCGVITPFDLL